MIKCRTAVKQGFECVNCCLYCEKKETCEDVCDLMGDIENNKCSQQIGETELQVMQSAVPDVLKMITDITVQKKKLDEQEKLMKKKLQEAMEQHSVKKFENDKVIFTYVPATTRTSIDSDRLKKERPDIVKEYSKTSNVSASVRIKVK